MEQTESPVVFAARDDASDVSFPHDDGSRVPYKVFSSRAVYDREQERIFRGPTWNFVALEAEIPNAGDFKSTFVGDTPVVVTRTEDGALSAWVNRCAHRGAQVCRKSRGNAARTPASITSGASTIPATCSACRSGAARRDVRDAGRLRPEAARAAQVARRQLPRAVFATFSDDVMPLPDYLGEQMRPWIDRIFHKPIEYLGCTRQYSKSNWKLYMENVKDPYHASMLHLFHTTFNIFRVGMKARSIPDANHGLHSIITVTKTGDDTSAAYKQQNIRSFDEGFHLEDESILDLVSEYDEDCTNHIQPIFPQLVIQQIHNTLVARQILPKGPDNFELIFHFFGYVDDTPELRALRIKQANLVGPAGYISMEDTEATEAVQRGTVRDGDATSVIEMSRGNPDQQDTVITESLIRKFWVGYQKLMGY